jgi:acyl-CoA synthetase (AMP-forming)/AMP-acid ligase II
MIHRVARVATLFLNCSQFIEALFATSTLAAGFVPINVRLGARKALARSPSRPAEVVPYAGDAASTARESTSEARAGGSAGGREPPFA